MFVNCARGAGAQQLLSTLDLILGAQLGARQEIRLLEAEGAAVLVDIVEEEVKVQDTVARVGQRGTGARKDLAAIMTAGSQAVTLACLLPGELTDRLGLISLTARDAVSFRLLLEWLSPN